jgi:hypothetical protein
MTINGIVDSKLIVSANPAGGVQLTEINSSHNDFNGDGQSDVLWRSDSGYLTEWVSNKDGSFTPNEANAGTGAADNSWQVVGTGDFNGDGHVDILWRNTSSGYVTDWLSNQNGGFTDNSANAGTGLANSSWQIAGTGDYNGDGISDILWRNASGYITEWLGTSSGGFTDNSAHAGTGLADNSWQIVGTGDFNGDGISDILWRNASSGYITEWLGTSSGGFTDNSAHAGTGLANNSWHVVGTGDYNGDGISDILWRNDSGYVTDWLGTSTGSFVDNSAHASTALANNTFHVQDPSF